MDRHKDSRQLHIWVDGYIYDACVELVNTKVYRSISELVRDGIDMAIDKASGYIDARNKEIVERYGEHELMETRIKIDGTLMRMRIYARWWHMHADTMLIPLIEDLHIPQALSIIEEKYGTKIELYSMHEPVVDYGDEYKETYAYKVEHGLIDDINYPPAGED